MDLQHRESAAIRPSARVRDVRSDRARRSMTLPMASFERAWKAHRSIPQAMPMSDERYKLALKFCARDGIDHSRAVLACYYKEISMAAKKKAAKKKAKKKG
jgi:hypothetical protein